MMSIKCRLCPRTSETHTIGKESKICNTCEQYFVYWNKKTARQKMIRYYQVESFVNRFEVILGNVKSIQKQSKKRARG
jgi:hypothetical protein